MRQRRDHEFMAMFREALMLFIDRNDKDPRKKAIEFTIHNGKPRYYVSHERAYIVVCSILKHGKNPVKPSLQAEMWNEIAQKVRQAVDSGAPSISKAIDFVLDNCRASRFFISCNYAERHTYVAAAEHRKKHETPVHNAQSSGSRLLATKRQPPTMRTITTQPQHITYHERQHTTKALDGNSHRPQRDI